MNNGFDWEKVIQENGEPTPMPPPKEVVDIDPRNGMPIVHEQKPAATPGPNEVLSTKELHLDDLLRMCVEKGGSDLHLTANLPPTIRLDGELLQLPFEPLDQRECSRLVYEIMRDEQVTIFEQTREMDFSYGVKDLSRFRVNVYMQKDSVGTAIRVIPARIPSFEDLRLPMIIREMARRTSGLILVTGPTGSGKSTTIASMIDDINASRKCHIMTIEDPIEYVHSHRTAMVNQREVHHDTMNFANALRAVLREDPDVILVGEMRDLETISAALTLAETGHLVFGTLHTRNAPQTVDRVVDVFPPDQQEQIRVLLANTLEGVIAQQLLPKLGGGRMAAIEVMIATPAIRNLIREGKTHQMYSVLETSAQLGMQTMDRTLLDMYKNGYVSFDEALVRAIDQENFGRMAKAA